MHLGSFALGDWYTSDKDLKELVSAVSGEPIATISSSGLDFAGMLDWARTKGGPALRELTFHERSWKLKETALYLNERKKDLYDLSFETGATKADSWIDIDGGIQTMFVFSSKGRREMPDDQVYVDGSMEMISRKGTFVGQHVCTPLQGAGIHINAFNFPVWGMLEKLAPTLLAGVPAIVKPASQTAYLTEACFRMIVDSGIWPEGAVQLICGRTGNMLDHVTSQDVISFTGSKSTALKLSQHPNVVDRATRFVAEQDSLNCTILGPDAGPDTPEFDLFIKEIVNEMTVKAGQKCTAIRRAIIPKAHYQAAQEALIDRLSSVVIGNPRDKEVRMGALASQDQRADVRDKITKLREENELIYGDMDEFEVRDADRDKGAFLPPVVFRCDNPLNARAVHEVEAFGPVSTLMPYDGLDEAVAIANKGDGSLVGSLFTHDGNVARKLVLGSGAYHGRLMILDRDSAGESTGHGSPLPHLVHGGPGRAGGGEEMGGVRGVMHYMQRTALQGSPTVLMAVTNRYMSGGKRKKTDVHPFRKYLEELEVGEAITCPPRKVTMEDVEHFAEFTGDKFYAHMDEEAAAANPFFERRVAHGYLILSFAAGQFVDPDPGPVLANTGLDNLQFMTPLYPGDEMHVTLTVKQVKPIKETHGEVRWDVEVTNQEGALVANYDLLTHNARKGADLSNV